MIGATTRERIITVKAEEWSPLNDEELSTDSSEMDAGAKMEILQKEV